MTARDREILTWLRDFIDNELAVVDFYPTIRRLNAAARYVERQLAKG